MNIAILVIHILIAAVAFLILFYEKLLKGINYLFIGILLLAGGMWIRWYLFPHVTLDYQDFLSPWVQYFRDNGGFEGLANSVGNYNIPYLTFLAAVSYVPLEDMYLIKMFSVLFDIILAAGAARIVGVFTKNQAARFCSFFAVFLLPTVVLNSAAWAQCDSIYAAFAVWSVYYGLVKKPWEAVSFMAIAFSFKLQAVFLMPILIIFLVTNRVKLYHFIALPIAYLVMCLPAILMGRPVMDTVMLYFNQAETVGSLLNYNSSSIFAILNISGENDAAAMVGIVAAALLVLGLIVYFFLMRNRASEAVIPQDGERKRVFVATGMDKALVVGAFILAVGVPFLLPHMHERYFFIADILAVCVAFVFPKYFILPFLVQFASLLGYHAYLMQRYLLTMNFGAFALIAALGLAILCLVLQLGKPKKIAMAKNEDKPQN